MEFQKCARCKKRQAVVFITRLENDAKINEGLCLVCARQLGIKPVEDMLKRMGMSEEDIENMSGEMGELFGTMPDMALEPQEENAIDGGAPAIDFQKIFSGLGLSLNQNPQKKQEKDSRRKEQPKANEKKILSA